MYLMFFLPLMHGHVQPVWKRSILASTRSSEKMILSEMNRRTLFLHNPRFSLGKKTEMAATSFHPAKKHLESGLKGSHKLSKLCHENQQVFIAKPKQVLFTDYCAGQNYEVNFLP